MQNENLVHIKESLEIVYKDSNHAVPSKSEF